MFVVVRVLVIIMDLIPARRVNYFLEEQLKMAAK